MYMEPSCGGVEISEVVKLENRRLNDYTLLRVFGILLVVLGHSNYTQISSYLGSIDYSSVYVNHTSSYGIIEYILSLIYTFHMPLFVFLAGAIYFYINIQLKQNYSLLTLIEKKYKRLLIPFFVVSIFYMVPIKLLTNYYSWSNLPKILTYGIFLATDCGHLWYIFMLFDLFIVFYLLEKRFNKVNIFINLIILLIIHLNYYQSPTNIFEIAHVGQYLIYFYIGYLFQKNKEIILNVINKHRVQYLLGTSLYFIILFHYVMGISSGAFRDTLKFCDALLGIAASYIFILNFLSVNVLNCKIIKLLDKYNFEIYLLHDPINYIILYLFSLLNLFPSVAVNEKYTIMFVGFRFIMTLIIPIIIMLTIGLIKNNLSITQIKKLGSSLFRVGNLN